LEIQGSNIKYSFPGEGGLMNKNTMTIYVRLLNEGTPVMRPTEAIQITGDAFKLLPTEGYDPDDEEWEFTPGTVVRCIYEDSTEGTIMVANSKGV
jgi:hypothetical protein